MGQARQGEDVVNTVPGQDGVEDITKQVVEEVAVASEEQQGSVGEGQVPTAEPRRSGRSRSANVKYDEKTWNLDRD